MYVLARQSCMTADHELVRLNRDSGRTGINSKLLEWVPGHTKRSADFLAFNEPTPLQQAILGLGFTTAE